MLDPYKLHIFVTAARRGTFSAAAEELLLTQSAISQHVKDLERQLGVPLFTRSRSGVKLTAAGEHLHQKAQVILNEMVMAEREIAEVANIQPTSISIGATPTLGMYVLPYWIQRFREHFPHVMAVMRTGTTTELLTQLQARQLDLVFIEGENAAQTTSGLHVLLLETYALAVIVGRKHPWWSLSTIELNMLDGQHFATRQRGSQTRLDRSLICAISGQPNSMCRVRQP